MSRPNGLFLALALLLAVVATAFGAFAVPPEHHHESEAGHDEHVTHSAEHEEEEGENALGVGEVLAALALSIFAVALVPLGCHATHSAGSPDVLCFTVAVASAGAATIHSSSINTLPSTGCSGCSSWEWLWLSWAG